MRFRCFLTGHAWERADERIAEGADGGLISTTVYRCRRCGRTKTDLVRGG